MIRSKLFLIFVYYLLQSFNSNAQTIKWSLALQDNKKFPYLKILGEDDNENFYVLKSNMSMENDREHSGFRNRSYLLQYFSSELTLIWEKDLKTSYEDGHITDIRLINGRPVVTSYLYDKKNKSYFFYSQYLDKDSKWMDKPVSVDTFSSEALDEDNKPGLVTSHDQSLAAFSYRKLTKDENSQTFRVVVLDTLLRSVYTREITIPVSVKMFVPLNFVLTDSGSFVILGIHYKTEKKIKAPDQSFYELFGYNFKHDRFIHTSIQSDSKFLTDVGMNADNLNNNIVVAGFYSDKTTYSTAGIFYYSLTEDSLTDTKTIHTPFSPAYLQKFMADQKENRELVNYSIDRLFVRKDGGVALIAESMYKTSRSYFDYYMQAYISHVYYHYGNIMVLSVNPDGNILWNNVINKDQNSVDDGGLFSSYFCAVTGGRLVSIYNKFADVNSSVLITFIDAEGMQKTDVLFNELEKVSIAAQSAKQIDDESVLVPAYRQNKFYIIRISF